MTRPLAPLLVPLLTVALLGAGAMTERPCCCTVAVDSARLEAAPTEAAPRSCCQSAAEPTPDEDDGRPASHAPNCKCDHGRTDAVAPASRLVPPDLAAGLPLVATLSRPLEAGTSHVAVAATERGSPRPLWLSHCSLLA